MSPRRGRTTPEPEEPVAEPVVAEAPAGPLTVTSTSGLTSVTVELNAATGKGHVTVTTYGRVTHSIPLQGEQMGRDDTP